MKKGDKFKITATDGEHHTYEQELDDGAKVTGVLANYEDGDEVPDDAEVVVAERVTGEPRTYQVKTAGHPGPARVSNKAFRAGWEGIFGARTDTELN